MVESEESKMKDNNKKEDKIKRNYILKDIYYQAEKKGGGGGEKRKNDHLRLNPQLSFLSSRQSTRNNCIRSRRNIQHLLSLLFQIFKIDLVLHLVT